MLSTIEGEKMMKTGYTENGNPYIYEEIEVKFKDEVKMNIEDTLIERGTRYGEFTEHARITQNIKRAMADSPNWDSLPPDMKETLEMIAHKAGRILNGDPLYHDSWHDIIGYTKLVADRLVK